MKSKFNLFLILLLIGCVYFVYATLADGTSDSPLDEWWMNGGNLTFDRYSHSNVPSNISDATMINISVGTTIGRNPIIVGDYLYILPANTHKIMRMNATNIREGLANSSSASYVLNLGSPTYYDGKIYLHSNGNLVSVNISNLSQTLQSVNIADGIYYGVPIVFNNSIYIGDGNAAPFFKQFNLSNISQTLNSLSFSGRIYESGAKNRDYFYVGNTGVFRQLNISNISHIINSVSCASGSTSWNFAVSDDYVYKQCTVGGVSTTVQFNATNITQVISNFTNASTTSVLGNGYLYVSSGGIAYQLNATNVSHVISNYSMGASTSITFFPLVTRDYYFTAGGSVLYQLNATNVSHLISNRTFPSSLVAGVVAAKGFLYVGAGNFLYQLGSYNPLSITDTSPPSVTLNNPIASYYNDTALPTLPFGCSATDSSSILNISLYLTNSLNQSFSLNQNSSTSGTSVSGNWNVSLTNGNYTWNCLAADELNNYGFASSNRSITINFTDSDGDGVSNFNDNLIGNSSSVTTSGFSYLNVTVNGTSANGTFSGVQEIAFYNSNSLIANFSFNFSSTTFNLENVTLIKGTNYVLVNFSGQVPAIYNKTLYLEDNDFDTLCLKDQEISSISEFSSGCDGSGEVNITSCISSSSTVNFGSVTCRDDGSTIVLGNLRNSAVLGVQISTASLQEEEEIFEEGKASYINEVYTDKKSVTLKFMSNSGVRLIKRIYDNKETGLREFEIKTKDWISGQIEVKKYDSLPDRCQIKKEDYVVYRALDFEHDFDNKDVDETRIRLEIEKDWINKNKVREIEVVRCYPEYEELKLSYISEDESFGIYDVYSQGFSIFAIIGTIDDKVVELSPRKGIPRWINFIIPFVLIIGLLIYLIMKFLGRSHGVKEDWHFKNKWFDFEFKFKIKTPPHKRKFLHDY